MPTTQPALWLALLWFSREIIGIIIRRMVSRSGRIGCIPDKCGFYHEVETDAGKKLIAKFDPDHFYENERALPLHISAELSNDTDIPLVLKDFSLTFWGPDGPSVIHGNPDVSSKGKVVNTMRIESHDTESLVINLMIERYDLQEMYAETLPVLKASDISGKTHSFRLSRRSFYGDEAVVWKTRKWPKYPDHLPIYCTIALNPTYSAWEVFLIDAGVRDVKPRKRHEEVSTKPASSENDT